MIQSQLKNRILNNVEDENISYSKKFKKESLDESLSSIQEEDDQIYNINGENSLMINGNDKHIPKKKKKHNHENQKVLSQEEKDNIKKLRQDSTQWKSQNATNDNSVIQDPSILLNSQTLNMTVRSSNEKIDIKIDLLCDIWFFEHSPVQQMFDMRKNWVISENSVVTQSSTLIITLSLFFYIIVFPQETQSETWLETDPTQLQIQIVIEWFFLIDILLNFFTVCSDEFGRNLITVTEISKNQLQNWFLVDIISSVPANNLTQQGFLEGQNFNVYLKILKFPKYTRIFRGIFSVFGSKISELQIDSFIQFNNNDYVKYQNILKYFIMFVVLTNLLVCMLISYTFECEVLSKCNNWFYSIMVDEFDYSLSHKQARYYSMAKHIQDTSETSSDAQLNFQNEAQKKRTLLQINGQQFILQTVTTVGQGDVGTSNSMERIFRCVCMIIGVILFTLLSSSVLETTISDSLNIYKNNIHEVMIEKLTQKQDLKGAPKRYLSLLGDSVQTVDLQSEKNFIDKLPKQMREEVIHQIQNIYCNKLNVLKEEGVDFFITFMKLASFRRCVVDEIIDDDDDELNLTHNQRTGKISIVYSGNLVCTVNNLSKMLNQDNLKSVDMGDEVGAHNQLNLSPNTQNQQVRCSCNSEIVEVKAPDFYSLIIKSLKNLNQIQILIEEYVNELQMICSLQQAMLKQGLYIDQSWYRSTLSDLRISKKDFIIFEKIYQNIQNKDNITIDKQDLKGKWQEFMIDYESQKQITNKNKMRLRELVRDKYISILKQNRTKRGSTGTDL